MIDKKIKIVDYISLSCVLYTLPIYIYFLKECYILGLLGTLNSLFSFLYHITYEQIEFYLRLDQLFSICTLTYFLHDITFYTTNQTEYCIYIFLLILSILFYSLGTGRHQTVYRSDNYSTYHLLWHLSIFVLSTIHALNK